MRVRDRNWNNTTRSRRFSRAVQNNATFSASEMTIANAIETCKELAGPTGLQDALGELAEGDTIVAETEIRRRSDAESDKQIIDLVKSLSTTELKKMGLKRLEHNQDLDCHCRFCAHHRSPRTKK
jgi:hypothetical protein